MVVTCHHRRRHHVRVPEYRLSGVPPPTDELAQDLAFRTSLTRDRSPSALDTKDLVVCAAEVGTRDSGSGAETKYQASCRNFSNAPGVISRPGKDRFRAQKFAVSEILTLC